MGSDAQAIPTASRSLNMCVKCLFAVQYLPQGVKEVKQKVIEKAKGKTESQTFLREGMEELAAQHLIRHRTTYLLVILHQTVVNPKTRDENPF
jgi:hypothetical protein